MANAVLTTVGAFVPERRDNDFLTSKLANAVRNDLTAMQEVLGRPDFTVQAGSDTAAALILIDLVARGVTFPPGTYRWIVADIFTRNSANSESAWKRIVALVVGGAPPTIPAASVTLINSASAGLDTELTAEISIQSNVPVLRLVTVPAAQFNHRAEVYVGPLFDINNVNT